MQEALRCLLNVQQGATLVGTAPSLDEARALCGVSAPNVALVCASTLRDSKLEGVPPAVVLFCTGTGPHRVHAALDHGAVGVVTERDTSETVARALRAVAGGADPWVSPEAATLLATAPDVSLTPRERDVLAAAALGHSNAQIALDFGLSAGTVRNHLSAAYAKLGVRTRGAAVAWAWQHGFAPGAPPKLLDP